MPRAARPRERGACMAASASRRSGSLRATRSAAGNGSGSASRRCRWSRDDAVQEPRRAACSSRRTPARCRPCGPRRSPRRPRAPAARTPCTAISSVPPRPSRISPCTCTSEPGSSMRARWRWLNQTAVSPPLSSTICAVTIAQVAAARRALAHRLDDPAHGRDVARRQQQHRATSRPRSRGRCGEASRAGRRPSRDLGARATARAGPGPRAARASTDGSGAVRGRARSAAASRNGSRSALTSTARARARPRPPAPGPGPARLLRRRAAGPRPR